MIEYSNLKIYLYFPFFSSTGAAGLSAAVTAREEHVDCEEESLNTPQIYCTEASQTSHTQASQTSHTQHSSCSTASTITTATSISTAQPVILKVHRVSIKLYSV